ncbi:MAG: EamA family transporter [Nitrospirae bacterium]|nr:EamA family transporter [Nitrospirota bacterium]
MAAILLATSDALTKKALVSRDEYFIAWARLLFALPVLLTSLTFIEIPRIDRTFWTAVLCSLPLEVAAIVLYTKALKVSPISLSIPFLALTPIFLMGTSYLILGERVTVTGGFGILLIAIGGYLLNIHKARQGFIQPIKAIFREKGSVMMIMVAFLYSITSSLVKMAIGHSSPVFFGGIYFMLVTLLLTPIAFVKHKARLTITKNDLLPLSTIGFTYSLMIIFNMVAISMTNVAYMISIKRTSLVFSILYGHFLFKEEKISERAIGGIIMFAGFILIVLGS